MEDAIAPSPRYALKIRWILLFSAIVMIASCVCAEQVPVLHRQGAIHGFLLLQDEHGKDIAVGDQTNQVHGSVIHARTIFHFRDGSVDDEETIYRQGSTFQLLHDHHIQKGPSFQKPVDVTIDVQKGEVTWVDPSGKDQEPKSQHMSLPHDLANGMIPLFIQNFPHDAGELKVSYLGVDSKPRLITVDMKPDGTDKILVGGSGRQADRFNVHFDLGGLASVVAPIIGKQPPDIGVWIVDESDPVFVKLVGPLCENGPTWTVLLTAPTWPAQDLKK